VSCPCQSGPQTPARARLADWVAACLQAQLIRVHLQPPLLHHLRMLQPCTVHAVYQAADAAEAAQAAQAAGPTTPMSRLPVYMLRFSMMLKC
jgi:hypothetical protein